MRICLICFREARESILYDKSRMQRRQEVGWRDSQSASQMRYEMNCEADVHTLSSLAATQKHLVLRQQKNLDLLLREHSRANMQIFVWRNIERRHKLKSIYLTINQIICRGYLVACPLNIEP